MNISKENIDALNAVLTLEFDKADYTANVDKATKEYGKKVALKGFRPGHAPASMIKKIYGKSILVDEINKLVSDTLSNYIKDNNLDILGEPLPNKDQQPIDFDQELDTITFKFDLGLSPEFDIDVNKDIKVPAYKITVDDEAVNKQIKNYASRLGTNVDGEQTSEASMIKGILTLGETKNAESLASISVIKDDAEKAKFLGKKVDDVIEFDIRKAYPDNTEISYLAGISKEDAEKIAEGTIASFKITKITDFKDAEINQELFDRVFPDDKIADEQAFRAKVKDTIEKTNAFAEDYRFNIDARKAAMDKVGDFQLPEEFLKRWLTVVNKDNEKFTPEVLTNEFPKFLKDLKWQVVKNRIGKKNDIKIEYKDIVEFAKKTARAQFMQYGITNIPEEQLAQYAANMLANKEQVNHLSEGAVEDKIIALFRDKADVENKEIKQEDFNKLFEAENY